MLSGGSLVVEDWSLESGSLEEEKREGVWLAAVPNFAEG